MTTHNMRIRGGFRWLCALVTFITLALPHLAFGGDDEPVEIIIQQSQSAPITEPTKPAQKGIYVQPHWVDGGYGVQVLEPGHWTDPEKQPGH